MFTDVSMPPNPPPPPPPSYPPPWTGKDDSWIIPVVVVCAILAALAPFIFIVSLSIYDCSAGIYCGPGEAGNTPLGAVVSIDYQGVHCTNSSSTELCVYAFGVDNASSGVTASDLRLMIEDSQGQYASASANSTVLQSNLTGCSLALWSFSTSQWSNPTQDACPGSGASRLLVSGETFVLHPVASGPSLSDKGLVLIIEGVAGALSGTITVPIP